ncbi:MAG: radical SAM protein [Anaerolineaceae bacterium]|jgi:DNA repair photolyase
MSRRAVFVPYRPKTVLNKSKRADHWFWTRYSAYPYIGCQHGCEFCYCRERKYCPYDDYRDFSYVIKVKENAPDLLRKGLSHAPVDVVFTGDYQPIERRFNISRKMLEVCYDLGFPVFVLERSPLVLRDLDLLTAIHERARAVVAFSAIYTPDSPQAERVHQMEHLAPTPEKRFAAMEKLAAAGILTGTCMMPVLPGLCDDRANLESVIRWTADHGGQFVLAGGLTLADQQRSYFFDTLTQRFPDLVDLYRRLYPEGSYAAVGNTWQKTALTIRELCERYGIRDRVPRPIIPGDKRTVNKRIVEALANRVYTMELNNEAASRVWAYRKAAWTVEDLEQDIRLVYSQLGVKGLQSIADIGPGLAPVVEQMIKDFQLKATSL